MQSHSLLLFVIIVLLTTRQGFSQPLARSKCASAQASDGALHKRGACLSSKNKYATSANKDTNIKHTNTKHTNTKHTNTKHTNIKHANGKDANVKSMNVKDIDLKDAIEDMIIKETKLKDTKPIILEARAICQQALLFPRRDRPPQNMEESERSDISFNVNVPSDYGLHSASSSPERFPEHFPEHFSEHFSEHFPKHSSEHSSSHSSSDSSYLSYNLDPDGYINEGTGNLEGGDHGKHQ
ncbi:hypothetical protein FA10DRAFT_259106 [Acaromyces ingoldii]|uniref:Uncharacterized protein n=1 Tax=Acaromyces ingoldii TaxID=215250 RepID=A0A316YR70_9BASI|nr:hypothetical protein FA10DRAFT_259106 [Acaromyces ingoldii]PWN91789.1 hypothetical protein FA10DRAFT_259106 [Acaromyces ingoldii]